MELLILSKLKWDLTAITAYEYLDHLITALKKSTYNDVDMESLSTNDNIESNQARYSIHQLLTSSSLRVNAEKIILLCATDYRFANLPPSVVASAALMSAIKQEICQNQSTKSQLRSIAIQENNGIKYSPPSTSYLANTSNQLIQATSSLRDINLNQIVARLQILTRVQMVSSIIDYEYTCLLYTSPSPRDLSTSRMPSSA